MSERPFDVAIVNYNTDAYLYNALVSLRDVLTPHAFGSVHVWDNGSADDSLAMLSAFAQEVPWLAVHASPRNVQHGPALDALLRHCCATKWVMVLDSDTEVIRDFSKDIPAFLSTDPAFVGQIHPEVGPLYAYLAHLMVNRSWYLQLPSFCDDGAPGIDLFRAIAQQGIPYATYRWSDSVRHAGQATLRGLVDRQERKHPLYRYAASAAEDVPKSAKRLEQEAHLSGRLRDFLHASAGPARGLNDGTAGAAPSWLVRSRRRQASGEGITFAWARPRTALAIGRARRIGLVQKTREIQRLLLLLRRNRPRRVLEIGTAYGGTFYLWTRVATDDATVISIDLPPWEIDDPAEPHRVRTLSKMARRQQVVHVLRGDSHGHDMASRLPALLGGEPLDFLFIDGDHSYEGVRRDFEMYSPAVAPGGIVALHDIHPHDRQWGGDVPRLWAEIKHAYRHQEIIEKRGQNGFAIGVLWMP